jgi:type 1 glutamine amidotransferase
MKKKVVALAAALGAAATLIAGAGPLLAAQPTAPAGPAGPPRSNDIPFNINEAKPAIPGQSLKGLRVYLRAGLKTHGEGFHDYPRFLAEWSNILNTQGAVVDGSYHSPTEAELANVDVLVIFKGDAGYMTPVERTALENFVKRGGGIVALHDALCGPDPTDAARFFGAGKRHGEVNYTNPAPVAYTITDAASPIMKGMTNFEIQDEAFYKLTWAPTGIKVLATNVIFTNASSTRGGGAGQTVPQIWTYEHSLPGGQPARAFTWMQGHTYTNFANPQLKAMLLRAIAWAGKRPVDELVDYKPPAPPAPQGAPARN